MITQREPSASWRSLAWWAALLCLAVAIPARAQNLPQLKDDFRNVYKVAISNPATTPLATVAISAAGNSALNPSNSRKAYAVANVAAGSAAYTYDLFLTGSSRVSGDVLEVLINLPASVNPTINVRDASATGTVLLTLAGPGRTAAQAYGASFVFNGTAWRGTWQPIPALTDPLVANTGQFSAGTSTGGFTVRNSIALTTTGVVGTPIYAKSADGTVQMRSATFHRPMALQTAQYQFGDMIAMPTMNGGVPVTVLAQPKNWPYTLDGSGNPTSTPNTDFYYSPDAQIVFASKPGVISIVWQIAGTNTTFTSQYIVSSSPAKQTRAMYWTELGFRGPKVSIPAGRVDALRFAYNPAFPQTVATTYPSPYVPVSSTGGASNTELRTIWYDSSDQLLHSYNQEGRILVEYLGPVRDSSGLRSFLGIEIVEVTREIAPSLIQVDIGTKMPPVPAGFTGEDLTADFIAGLNVGTDPFVFDHVTLGGSQHDYFAIRTTTPTFVGTSEVLSNEVLAYWLELGLRGIRWPKYYAGYIVSWPTDNSQYSLYVRPDQSQGDSSATAVQLNSNDAPTLVFQDDPSKQQAQLNASNQFYTTIGSGDPSNRALIMYTNGDDIFFERVLSELDSSFSGYNNPVSADIGTRITPPAALGSSVYDDGDGDVTNDVYIGYIRESTASRDYDPTAYINPFNAGFDEAKKGAIIGVNARPGKDQLEVWWYTKSQPTSKVIQPTYWPAAVQKYTLQWPAGAGEIVLASNIGSNDIGLAGNGSIYTQNDPSKAGYNPNEEHALMLEGRAWALRDDLNVHDATFPQRYSSSAPYVLVRYMEADNRPAMKVFHVSRENSVYKFRYPATAGTPLGAPSPLNLLPPPLDAQGRTRNLEVPTTPDIPPGLTAPVADPNSLYGAFTFTDRKQNLWIYRGRHDGGVGEFAMQYRYPTQPGFYFPQLSTQPAVGTVVPYLRPLDTTGNPIGAPDTGTPLTVYYEPQWPASAPVLNVGDTLTLARDGLPQIRGQSSVEVIYQQSLANTLSQSTPKKSIRLYDPTLIKKFDLVNATTGAIRLAGIPSSINTSDVLGKKYFPDLPPHLSQRFYYDPNVGRSASAADGSLVQGSLIFKGTFTDEVLTADYLLPNVMSPSDLAAVKALCQPTDPKLAAWQNAIDGLTGELDNYVEQAAQPGTFQPVAETTGGPRDPLEVTLASTSSQPYQPVGVAVDSYAVSALDGGTGFVVLATGNGNKKIQADGEPVSLQVFQVARPLARGELKVINSSNPLDEKVTLQHSLDFAGNPDRYEFQWIYAQRSAEGSAPSLYSVSRALLVGDGPWRLIQNPPDSYSQYRNTTYNDAGNAAFTDITLPANQVVINTDPATYDTINPGAPNSILRRVFQAGGTTLQLYVSLDLFNSAGAIIYLNNVQVAAINVPGVSDTPETTAPGLGFTPLTHVYQVPTSALLPNDNVLTIQLYGTTIGAVPVNARLEGAVTSDDPSVLPTGWLLLTGPTAGLNRYVIQGSSDQTLSDNYFAVRYREVGADDSGWSTWTDPQLVEGWIKRVLTGINPFDQRVSDLLNNPVDTDVSLLTQAGPRWEGNIALTLDNIDNVGLIQIYETVLRRGILLSIDGAPRRNDPDANGALLLAAGYLSDLYDILGDEAFADAANPTIAVGADNAGNFGDVTTSLFAFKGEVATVLDEEMALLRGRDDLLAPGTTTAPVYNRLVWNYTNGISSGEAVYAVNYDIKDANADGKVDATDAATLFPQGHGDAYGHYLTALTGYYRLLTDDFFSWVPRSESVLVLGKEVAVDYFDERKFAGDASKLAQTASQVLDLTYRQAYNASDSSGWTSLKDLQNGQPVTNPQTLVTRAWGTDDWACRGGQGALLNWITANSGLPDVDPDPTHEGIQKIDRTTVPELNDIVTQAQAIQTTLDNADARLNPLGVSRGVVSFDISPSDIDAGKTHFEQIYDRAIAALQNTVDAFNSARTSSDFLRAQDDSLDDLRASIDQQETAFNNQLIDLYGTPYPDDIGAGKTYVQDYDGPDLIHPFYVALPEQFNRPTTQTFSLTLSEALFTTDTPFLISNTVSITLDTNGLPIIPDSFVGQRAHPGQIQQDVSNYLSARLRAIDAITNLNLANQALVADVNLVNATIDNHNSAVSTQTTYNASIASLTVLSKALGAARDYLAAQGSTALLLGSIAADGFPKVVGLANDVTSAGRASVQLAALGAKEGFDSAGAVLKVAQTATDGTIQTLNAVLASKLADLQWSLEEQQMIYDLQAKLRDYTATKTAIDEALRGIDDAKRQLQADIASGEAIQSQRETFRQHSAAIIQGYRTKDLAFRAFRDEALQRYKTLFDLSARYTYLAARAYDYETGLLDSAGNSQANAFFSQIVKARAPGVLVDGRPQFGGASTGDPGLAGVLAQLNGDWSVVKTRLGFNNPDRYQTTFSLRGELYRILPTTDGDAAWKEQLDAHRVANILDDADVRRYCMQAGDPNGLAVPGIVIDFPTTIANGVNFFGQALAGGDHGFTPTSFATKVRSAGIAFPGYIGMDDPSSTSGALSSIGASTPSSPGTGFTDADSLSATPYIYLIPVGADSMRSPPLGDSSTVRSWQVEDQAIPLPFDISGIDFSTRTTFVSSDSLTEPPFQVRRHQSFRAVPGGTVFSSQPGFTNSRLIGRSVWNSHWKIIIPGNTLLNDPVKGLDTFARTVKDIQLHLETYSYSGN